LVGVDEGHSGCFIIEDWYSIRGRDRRFFLRLNVKTGCKIERVPVEGYVTGDRKVDMT